MQGYAPHSGSSMGERTVYPNVLIAKPLDITDIEGFLLCGRIRKFSLI